MTHQSCYGFEQQQRRCTCNKSSGMRVLGGKPTVPLPCNATMPALPKAVTHVFRPEVGSIMLEWKLKIDVTAFRVVKPHSQNNGAAYCIYLRGMLACKKHLKKSHLTGLQCSSVTLCQLCHFFSIVLAKFTLTTLKLKTKA